MQALREQQNLLRAQRQARELLQAKEQGRLREAIANIAGQEPTPQSTLPERGHYQGIKLPKAVYRDKTTRQEIDLWEKLTQGDDLSDPQLDQLIHSIEIMQYSARTPDELMDAEVIDNMARELVIENKLARLEEVEPGYWEYNGMLLEEDLAALAVESDVDHYWETNTHLTPEQIKEKLKDIAVGVWNFLYGDDINTLLDPDAHPVARIWAAAQLIPVMKVTKAGKLVKLVKFKTPVPLSKMFPTRNIARGGPIWSDGTYNNRFKNALRHAKDHTQEFPELHTRSVRQYVQKTWEFYRKPPAGTRVKVLPSGQRVLYHPPSNTILFTDRHGVPASMYKPKAGINKFYEPKNKGVNTSVILRRRP